LKLELNVVSAVFTLTLPPFDHLLLMLLTHSLDSELIRHRQLPDESFTFAFVAICRLIELALAIWLLCHKNLTFFWTAESRS
jgi:hypothetical protein